MLKFFPMSNFKDVLIRFVAAIVVAKCWQEQQQQKQIQQNIDRKESTSSFHWKNFHFCLENNKNKKVSN